MHTVLIVLLTLLSLAVGGAVGIKLLWKLVHSLYSTTGE